MSGMKNTLVTPSEAASEMDAISLTRDEIWNLKFKMEQKIAEEVMKFYRASGGMFIYEMEVSFRREPWVGPSLPASATLTTVNINTQARL